MKRKREVLDARAAWRLAAWDLDGAIGLEVEGGAQPEAVQTVNARRFRKALMRERAARVRYAAALTADGKPVPDDLLWDISRQEWSGVARRDSDRLPPRPRGIDG